MDILTHAHNPFSLPNINQDDETFPNRPLHNMPMGKHELCLCGGLTKKMNHTVNSNVLT